MDAPGSTPNRRASLKILSRNIDTVVLGNILFHTWYYSPYPDAIISTNTPKQPPADIRNNITSAHTGLTPTKAGITCPRLHVCPLCFAYTPDASDYAQHLLHHQAEFQHSDSEEPGPLPVPDSAFPVYAHDGYTVYEVDGETEKPYCQNLSLFGKLFLEQKSVFFDTGGFKYYVLTHTVESSGGVGRGRKRRRTSSASGPKDVGQLFPTQVLGFFSKENLSWDSNNLACILVFPPFQHRRLGQLLMAVSYKLSGWEWEGGVIGGPEKPLSAMGRRSYTRFWAERVARYFLGETADADAVKVLERVKKRKNGLAKEEMSVREIGERTGMLVEDVLCALGEMDICEVRKGKRKKGSDEGVEGHEEDAAMMTVSRAKVVKWAEENKVDVIAPVKEEGFLGEWALSDVDDEEEDGEVEDSE